MSIALDSLISEKRQPSAAFQGKTNEGQLRGGCRKSVTPFPFGRARTMDFKGFQDWIPIFHGGIQTDSRGVQHDGDELIEAAIAAFDSARYKPPLVIGHPRNNAPAFGWVSGLKKFGNVLYAKFKDVVPAFEALVKNGLFKKRSARFAPDGSLIHVGFLGAMPPAVKGLADLNFQERRMDMGFDFALSEDPGEILHQKTMELLNNPPKFDKYGRKSNELTYTQAFTIVQEENPELAEQYFQSTRPKREITI